MQTLLWKRFQIKNITEYLEFAYDSYSKVNYAYNDRQAFNTHTKTILTCMILASQYINQRDHSTIIFNSFLRYQGKMVSATFQCDAEYFYQSLSRQIEIDSAELFPQGHVSKEKKALIGLRHCVRPQYLNSKVYSYHFWLNSQHFLANAYEVGYSVVLNPFSLILIKRQGGQIVDIRQVTFKGIKMQKNCVVVELIKGTLYLKDIDPRL